MDLEGERTKNLINLTVCDTATNPVTGYGRRTVKWMAYHHRRKSGDWRKGRSKPGIQKDNIAPEIQTGPVASNRLRSAGEVLVACGLRE